MQRGGGGKKTPSACKLSNGGLVDSQRVVVTREPPPLTRITSGGVVDRQRRAVVTRALPPLTIRATEGLAVAEGWWWQKNILHSQIERRRGCRQSEGSGDKRTTSACDSSDRGVVDRQRRENRLRSQIEQRSREGLAVAEGWWWAVARKHPPLAN